MTALETIGATLLVIVALAVIGAMAVLVVPAGESFVPCHADRGSHPELAAECGR